MSIKYISFDLDDTFWDVMPTIYRAEDKTKEWIKDNFPGVTKVMDTDCLLYTSPSPRDLSTSRMPSSA